MVGGYVIIDLKKVSIDNDPVKIPGVYDKIEASFGKPILLRNIVIREKEIHSAYCLAGDYGAEFLLVVSFTNQGVITFVRVDQEDNVSVIGFTPSAQSGDEPFSGEDGPSASM